ncbi:helix-turn-helix domain-containing protein [Halobacteriaceae archaeon GCM10025711]
MPQETRDTQPSGKVTEQRTLRLVLELTPGETCPIIALDESVQDIRTHVADGDCHCDFTVSEPTDDGERTVVEHTERAVDAHCACRVFHRFDAIPHVTDVREDSYVVSTFVADRAAALSLVDSLDDVCTSVRLLRLTTSDAVGLGAIPVEVDLAELTPKQREALERAEAAGYFRTPHEVSLDELAAEFDISASALSQRLAAAEEKVMEQLFRR